MPTGTIARLLIDKGFGFILATDGNEYFRNFLAVSSHILHGSSADRSGDAAQAFDSCKITIHTQAHESVPFLTRAGANDGFIPMSFPIDARQTDFHNETRKAVIGDQKVGASAEHKHRLILVFCKLNRAQNNVFGRSVYEISCRAADTKSS